MVINNIKACGFQRLFEAYKTALDDGRNGFRTGLFPYLMHSMITIDISKLTMIEVFYLKTFASNVHIVSENYGNFVNKETSFDTYQKVEELLKLHDQILNDDDIDKDKSSINNILPVGCSLFRVVVTFNGPSILGITGAHFEDIFKSDDGIMSKVFPSTVELENNIAREFYSKFYNNMKEKMTDIDVLGEFMSNKKFYQYSESPCELAHVNSIHGDLVFFGSSSTDLQNQISNIKESQLKTPYSFDNNVYLTYVCNTTFSTFFKLYMNSDTVIDYMNLKIIFPDTQLYISDDINVKYNARISNSIDYINSYKKTLSELNIVDLNKFSYIFNGTKIKYSIQLSLDNKGNIPEIFKKYRYIDEIYQINEQIERSSKMISNIFS